MCFKQKIYIHGMLLKIVLNVNAFTMFSKYKS